MKIRNSTTGLITILFIALGSSSPGLANDRYVLHYDHPIAKDLKRLDHSVPRSQINNRFMTQALPLGNGRFGAMFSGHVDSEYLVFNDITLWMNSTRGESKFKQSGSRTDGKDYLEVVRAACREGKYGAKAGSAEALGTKYLASKQPLGNFAPFADLEIRTGHDPSAADDYRRALDISTGVGSVRYTVGDVKYSREYFCSHPHDVFAARFTADGGTMDLVLEARTAHPKRTITSKGREIHLRGSARTYPNSRNWSRPLFDAIGPLNRLKGTPARTTTPCCGVRAPAACRCFSIASTVLCPPYAQFTENAPAILPSRVFGSSFFNSASIGPEIPARIAIDAA